MSRTMRFKIEPKLASCPEFLLFMSQSHFKVEYISEINEISVEIPTESPAEIEKLLNSISNSFDILNFSSGNNLHFIEDSKEQEVNISNSDNKMLFDFSFLSEECSDKALTKLCQTIHWACIRKNVSEADIAKFFVWTIIKEISLHYSDNHPVEFKIGDVVSIINSSSVIEGIRYSKGIVCNIVDNSVFIIPIAECYNAKSFSENEIVFLNKELYNKNYDINYEASRYLSKKRIESVIGRVTSDFFGILLDNLTETFSFFNNAHQDSSSSTNNNIQESALFEVFGSAFENLSKSQNFNSFFKEIELSDKSLREICMNCSKLEKINWDSITQKYSYSRTDLKNSFKEWLEKHPSLKEKYPTLSFTSLLKVIKKSITK